MADVEERWRAGVGCVIGVIITRSVVAGHGVAPRGRHMQWEVREGDDARVGHGAPYLEAEFGREEGE
jgi:hypothetical protein